MDGKHTKKADKNWSHKKVWGLMLQEYMEAQEHMHYLHNRERETYGFTH